MWAVIIVILILVVFYLYHSAWNTHKVNGFSVHTAYNDQVEASDLMRNINDRNMTLINHLRKKYVDSSVKQPDPFKSGRIDIINATDVYHELMKPQYAEYIQERVTQLTTNYDSENMYEISPFNKQNATAYTENKSVLVLCLREKNKSHRLHDINTMMFVVLHELSHMMNNNWGHEEDFWELFRFMLNNGTECGIYVPVNYRAAPVVYCGLRIDYNPMFDK